MFKKVVGVESEGGFVFGSQDSFKLNDDDESDIVCNATLNESQNRRLMLADDDTVCHAKSGLDEVGVDSEWGFSLKGNFQRRRLDVELVVLAEAWPNFVWFLQIYLWSNVTTLIKNSLFC